MSIARPGGYPVRRRPPDFGRNSRRIGATRIDHDATATRFDDAGAASRPECPGLLRWPHRRRARLFGRAELARRRRLCARCLFLRDRRWRGCHGLRHPYVDRPCGDRPADPGGHRCPVDPRRAQPLACRPCCRKRGVPGLRDHRQCFDGQHPGRAQGGLESGMPPIRPLVLPTRTFDRSLGLQVGSLRSNCSVSTSTATMAPC